MPITIGDIQTLVNAHIQDDAGKLISAEVLKAIEEALGGRYSKDRPRRRVADLTGNGGQFEWSLSTIAGWQEAFSHISAIEYPQGESMPVFLDSQDWMIYDAPSGRTLRFAFALASGKTARLTYTSAHALDATSTPDADLYAVAALAAALAARRLAAVYAQTGDTSIAADTVNYRSKSQEYLALARRLEQDYENLLGTDPERSAPASSRTGTWRGTTAGGGRLTH